eukprot:Nitzschia sp. Nitz4//scaffold280_size24494//23009//23620//NITZ4_008396-RA/size24494-processed-gene-0.29-mRNA-1//1//CDS//3329545603//514//frame0
MGRDGSLRFVPSLRFGKSRRNSKSSEDMESLGNAASCSSSQRTWFNKALEDCPSEDESSLVLTRPGACHHRSSSERSTLSEGSDASGASSSSCKHVRFGKSQVRSYPQVMGEHPFCRLGCPLELGWEPSEEFECSVDEFENTHRSMNLDARQCPETLRMTPEERRAILQDAVTDLEVRKACRRRNRERCCKPKKLQREFFGAR